MEISSPAASAAFESMTADGTGLVALSYRGYAGSSGQPSEQGLLQDAAAAYAFTAARYGADRIVVWGFSLGTGVAVALAAEQPVGKLILEAPYTSIADRCRSVFPVRAGTLAVCGTSFAPTSGSRGSPLRS